MKNVRGAQFRELLCGLLILFASVVLPSRLALGTNDKGNNAVYNASGPTGSAAFIDASVFSSTGTEICVTLYNIISDPTYPATGAVVDALGINSTNAAN